MEVPFCPRHALPHHCCGALQPPAHACRPGRTCTLAVWGYNFLSMHSLTIAVGFCRKLRVLAIQEGPVLLLMASVYPQDKLSPETVPALPLLWGSAAGCACLPSRKDLSTSSPAAPLFSGWNCVAHRLPFCRAATKGPP